MQHYVCKFIKHDMAKTRSRQLNLELQSLVMHFRFYDRSVIVLPMGYTLTYCKAEVPNRGYEIKCQGVRRSLATEQLFERFVKRLAIF